MICNAAQINKTMMFYILNVNACEVIINIMKFAVDLPLKRFANVLCRCGGV